MDQTEQTQSKPRRRRRWLIVTVVLVLLASVSWWYYPRGDARFVGKWRDDTANPTMWTFCSNGVLVRESSREHWNTTWRIDGDFLITGRPWKPKSFDRIIPLSDLWGKISDLRPSDVTERIGIQYLSHNDLELNFRGIELFRLKRLPE